MALLQLKLKIGIGIKYKEKRKGVQDFTTQIAKGGIKALKGGSRGLKPNKIVKNIINYPIKLGTISPFIMKI